MLVNKFRTPITLAALLASVTLGTAARADMVTSVVKTVVDATGHVVTGTVTASGDIVDATGRVVGHSVSGTLDKTGNLLDASGHIIGHVSGTGSDTVVFSNAIEGSIDSRRLAYDALLADALANNRINAAQAAEYRATLKRIYDLEQTDLSDNILSYDEANALASQLDAFGAPLYSVAQISPWSPLLVTTNGATTISVTPTYFAPASTTTVSAYNDASSTTTTTSTTVVGGPAVVSTPVVASTDGTVVKIQTATPELYITTIETRRKDLDKAIDRAKDQGKITGKQADVMKAELRRIAHETGTNKITYSRAVMYAQDLDLIGTQLGPVVAVGGYVPIIQGSHFTVYNGTIIELDDLSVRRAELEARITKDYLQGRLTDSQVISLRSQLDAVGLAANNYTASGETNFKETKALYKDFDHIASELEKFAGKDNN